MLLAVEGQAAERRKWRGDRQRPPLVTVTSSYTKEDGGHSRSGDLSLQPGRSGPGLRFPPFMWHRDVKCSLIGRQPYHVVSACAKARSDHSDDCSPACVGWGLSSVGDSPSAPWSGLWHPFFNSLKKIQVIIFHFIDHVRTHGGSQPHVRGPRLVLSHFEFTYLCGYSTNTCFLPQVPWSPAPQGGHRWHWKCVAHLGEERRASSLGPWGFPLLFSGWPSSVLLPLKRSLFKLTRNVSEHEKNNLLIYSSFFFFFFEEI